MEKITVEIEASDLLNIIETCPPENFIFLGSVIKKMKLQCFLSEKVKNAWINRCHNLRMGIAVDSKGGLYFQRKDCHQSRATSSDAPYFGVPSALGFKGYEAHSGTKQVPF